MTVAELIAELQKFDPGLPLEEIAPGHPYAEVHLSLLAARERLIRSDMERLQDQWHRDQKRIQELEAKQDGAGECLPTETILWGPSGDPIGVTTLPTWYRPFSFEDKVEYWKKAEENF